MEALELFGKKVLPHIRAEAISKYILVDMSAKAVQGMAPADAVTWAHRELVKIYA